MKPREDIITDFNNVVNMTASELEAWLKSNDSSSAGWPKDDGSGESVGHDSGRHIVEILKSNPNKEPEKYTDEDVEHMRKVVAYCKRHLAQETGRNNEKTADEIKKTKSYASLKNWGHDFLRAQGKDDTDGNEPGSKSGDTHGNKNIGAEDKHGKKKSLKSGGDEEHDVDGNVKEHAGTKRKASSRELRSSKKRETQKGPDSTKSEKGGLAGGEEKSELNRTTNDEEEHAGNKRKASGKEQKPSKKQEIHKGHASTKSGETDLQKGDDVSWNWGGGHPHGKVLDVKEEKTSIQSKNNNTITRKGRPEDPAVVLDAGKSKAIKLAHELD